MSSAWQRHALVGKPKRQRGDLPAFAASEVLQHLRRGSVRGQ
jgi:hypothetical protein